MLSKNTSKKKKGAVLAVLVASTALLSAAPVASQAIAQESGFNEETLLDRLLIEDLIVSYYADLTSGSHTLADYFTEDAVFILNGTEYEGHDAITKVYNDLRADSSDLRDSKTHMMLTNLNIDVDGDTAKASMIWTGVKNDHIKAPPRLFEQGREYDKLVKKDGRWYFTERVIAADSGMPDFYDDIYSEYEPE